MIEKIASESARFLVRELNLDELKSEILAYSVKILLSSVIGYFAIIVLSAAVGVLPWALAAAITASVLRTFSGGAHADSPFNCTVIGTLIFSGLGLASKYTFGPMEAFLFPVVGGVFLTAVYCVLRYAPADTHNKPITGETHRRRLRNAAAAYVMVWGVAVMAAAPLNIYNEIIYASTLGLFWQALSLTPAGYILAGILNKVINDFKKLF